MRGIGIGVRKRLLSFTVNGLTVFPASVILEGLLGGIAQASRHPSLIMR
jgi:hypothetical protein